MVFEVKAGWVPLLMMLHQPCKHDVRHWQSYVPGRTEGCDLEVAVEETGLLVEDVAALPALCTATMKAAQNKSRRAALSGPMTRTSERLFE